MNKDLWKDSPGESSQPWDRKELGFESDLTSNLFQHVLNDNE